MELIFCELADLVDLLLKDTERALLMRLKFLNYDFDSFLGKFFLRPEKGLLTAAGFPSLLAE